jgi:type I restriction enzyme S subunit
MNAARLLEHFDLISDAADAVPRLRRLVLDLAIRGKLVEQREGQPLSHSQHGSPLPFLIPSQWHATTVGESLQMINGRAFKPADWLPQGLPIVRIQNLNNGAASFNYCKPDAVDLKHVIDDGTFLISWSGTPGTSFGAFIWRRGKAALNQHIFKCLPRTALFDDRFLQISINGRLDEMIAKAHGGVGLQHITKGKLEALAIPLPPLAEQQRIVAKVNELMALCDRLEAAQVEREARRDRLVAASLARVSQPAADDAGSDARAAGFHLDHFARLTTRPEHVKHLRQTILNLAVRGRLVPQDPADQSADAVLESIATASVSPKSGRPKDQTDGISAPPYSVPNSWAWTPFGSLIVASDSGWSPKTEGFPRIDTNWGVLKVSAVSWDAFLPEENKQLLPGVTPPERAVVNPGDFLISRANTSELIAKCVVVEQCPPRLIMSDKIVRLTLPDHVEKRFLFIVNNYADHARRHYAENATGTSLSMKNVSRDVIYSLPIPLPALAEQRRIVAKVDELMALCDQLEASLAAAATDRARLLESLLHEALAPAA